MYDLPTTLFRPEDVSGETVLCPHCHVAVPIEVWDRVRLDHPVIVVTPLRFDALAADAHDNMVHFRVHQSFAVRLCSEIQDAKL